MTRPLFSIIIPAYNRSGHLVAAVESVLAQTFREFELVVVDDGSTDDTRERMAALCASDERIKYVSKENGGRSTARNRGIDESSGDWLIFLDSDDLLEPAALETFVELIEEFPHVDVLAGSKTFIDESGEAIAAPWTENDPDEVYGAIDDPYLRIIRQFFFTPGTFCIRRDKCPKFRREFEVCEDYDFLLNAATSCSFVRSPKQVHRYRWHAGNTDQGLFASARLRIAADNEAVVENFLNPRKRKVRAEWANRKADDFYEQGRGLSAFYEYLKALVLNPLKVREGQIPRQMLASLVPAVIRGLLKRRA